MGLCVSVIMGEDGSGGMMDSQFTQMLSGGGGFLGFGGGGQGDHSPPQEVVDGGS